MQSRLNQKPSLAEIDEERAREWGGKRKVFHTNSKGEVKDDRNRGGEQLVAAKC